MKGALLVFTWLLATPSSVVLRWKAVDGAVLYDLEIASDPQFKDVVLAVRIATNGYRWEAAPEKPHWFRARGIDQEHRAGPWSESKEIAAVFVAPPLTKPAKGQSLALDPQGTRVELDFEPTAIFVKYRLEIASDDKFEKVVYDKTQEAPPFVYVATSGGTYFYRLSAIAEDGKATAPGPVGSFNLGFPGPDALTSERQEVEAGRDVALSWRACKPCVTYRVQVGRDPKWKSGSVVDERRTTDPRLVYRPAAEGQYVWRVIGEDKSGRRSAPSTTQKLTVTATAAATAPASAPALLSAEGPGVYGFFGVVHQFAWNFQLTVSGVARAEAGIAFPLGQGRFLAFVSFGLHTMRPPVAEVTGPVSLVLFPVTVVLAYQLSLGAWRLRFGAFPAVNPGFLMGAAAGNMLPGVGFGVGGAVALGYSFGPVQAFLDLRASYAPLSTGGLRVHTGGLVIGAGFWYEP